MIDRKADAESKFGVVFKQGVGESRAKATSCHGLRERRGKEAVCLGTACCIGSIHPVSEELSEKLDIRRLTAAGAGTGEFVERLLILAAFRCKSVHRILFLREGQAVFPVGLLMELAFQRSHREGFFL